jgi:hypothetical protein
MNLNYANETYSEVQDLMQINTAGPNDDKMYCGASLTKFKK